MSKKKQRGIYERSPGRWWIRYADKRGKIHREAIGPKSLAERMYMIRKAEIAEGRFIPGRRNATVGEAIDGYLKSAAKVKSRRDVERYAKLWRERIGAVGCRDLTGAEIDAEIAPRREKVSNQTIHHELSFLRAAFSWAIKARYCERSPVEDARWPKVNNARVRYLADEEEARLREHVKPKHWPVIEFAIHTGLRKSEQFGLEWRNVDLRAGVVTIPTSKSGKVRHVELSKTAAAILATWPRTLHDKRVFAINGDNFVKRVFLKAAAEASIENLHWHDLRHTFASRLTMGGCPPQTLAELLGHSSLAMVMRYSHLSKGHRKSAVEMLNGWHDKATDTISSTGNA